MLGLPAVPLISYRVDGALACPCLGQVVTIKLPHRGLNALTIARLRRLPQKFTGK